MESNTTENIENENSTSASRNDFQIDETIERPIPSPTKMKLPSGPVKKIKKQPLV